MAEFSYKPAGVSYGRPVLQFMPRVYCSSLQLLPNIPTAAELPDHLLTNTCSVAIIKAEIFPITISIYYPVDIGTISVPGPDGEAGFLGGYFSQ